MALGFSGSNGGITKMAMGFSGSNGGVQEAYRQFVLTDVDAGISKYEALYEKIPEEQAEVRNFYTEAISGLKELRQQMAKGLEATV